MGCRYSGGGIWASSRDGDAIDPGYGVSGSGRCEAANSDSKNRTLVVTIRSARPSFRRPVGFWRFPRCPPPRRYCDAPRPDRVRGFTEDLAEAQSVAVCSMMLVYKGMTWRSDPALTVALRVFGQGQAGQGLAAAPVGTVGQIRPVSPVAFSRHGRGSPRETVDRRFWRTGGREAGGQGVHVAIEGAQQSREVGVTAAQPGLLPSSMKASVSRKSASTRQETASAPEREARSAGHLAQVEVAALVSGEDLDGWHGVQCFPQLLGGAVAVEPVGQTGFIAAPVGQPRATTRRSGRPGRAPARPAVDRPGRAPAVEHGLCPVGPRCGRPGRSLG
jgi:hypothetical protein